MAGFKVMFSHGVEIIAMLGRDILEPSSAIVRNAEANYADDATCGATQGGGGPAA